MPSTQDLIVDMTKDAMRQLFVNARHIPEDNLTWRPMGEARDVLGILKECVILPVRIVGGLKGDSGNSEVAAALAERVVDIDSAEAVGNETCGMLADYVAGLSGTDLDEVISFGPGWKMPRANALMVPMRNTQYHVGQLAYIQLLLGDTEDHWS